MTAAALPKYDHPIKEPKGLSPRIQWLRDYYFQGAERAWNNEFVAWSTGTSWDVQFNETNFYIVPGTQGSTLILSIGVDRPGLM